MGQAGGAFDGGSNSGSSGAGGGSSAVLTASRAMGMAVLTGDPATDSRLLVAGGGGGSGTGIEACCGTDGGNAGDASVTGAGAGAPLTGECLFGSSAGAGGIGPTDGSDGGGAGGCPGTVAAGRDGSASSGGCCIGVGGGGGGGWFGGGEGGLVGGGGGGGSSYGGAGPSSITTASSSQSPEVVIRWTLATPSISRSQQPAAVTVGGRSPTRRRVRRLHPTGTVTFKPVRTTRTAMGTPLYTDTERVPEQRQRSPAEYTTTSDRTDYWVATYNGDGNNSSVTSGTSESR